MSKLNREQRLEIYKTTLHRLETRSSPVCLLLDNTAEDFGYGSELTGEVDLDFPEFYQQKPTDVLKDYSWWMGIPMQEKQQARIKALQAAIKLAEEGVYP